MMVGEAYMTILVTLSDAKARLSEVVRVVRTRGEDAVITVDGEPAVRVVPLAAGPRPLSSAEMAGVRALMASLSRIARPDDAPFDAVALVADGRR
jgi:prevent-host-death family protein